MFRREKHNILSGGVDILLPPEHLAPNQSSQGLNLAYDAASNLRLRLGSKKLFTCPGQPVTMIAALGDRYQIANSDLCKNGSNVGAAGGTVGICSMNKHVWVPGGGANGKKYDGTNYDDWGVIAPAIACTSVASNEAGALLTDLATATVDGGTASTVMGGPPAPSHPILQLDMVAGTAYVITASSIATKDLTDFHHYDLHRVWMHFGRAGSIGQVTLQVDVGDGSFTKDYFTAIIPAKTYKGTTKEWQMMYARMAQQSASDLTASFKRIGNTPKTGWDTVAGARVLIDCVANTRMKFSLWDVVGGVVTKNKFNRKVISGLIEGDDIQWYYTYVSDDEMAESNPSPPSTFLSLKRQAADLDGFAASSQPHITKINIYRSGGSLGATYRVNDTPLPIAKYHDDNGDDILTGLDEVMEVDNDLPPASATLSNGPYFGRILSFKGARMYWSKQNRPYAFANPDGPDGSWVDIGDTGDPVQNVTLRPTVAFIYKKYNTFLLSGDPDPSSGVLQDTGMAIGITNPNGVVKAANNDFMASWDGIYANAAGFATKISTAIDPIFKGRSVLLYSGQTIAPIQDKTTIALGFMNDRLYVSYDNISGLIFHIPTGRWFFDSRGISCYATDSIIVAGLPGGDVWQLETGSDDAGTPIALGYEKTLDCGLPDTDKQWEDFTIEGDTQGQSVGVVAIMDKGAGPTVSLGSIVTNGQQRQILSFASGYGSRGRDCTLFLTGSFTKPIDIRGMWVNYYLVAREAKSFDSEALSFGSTDLKRIREIMISMESDQPCTLQTSSDYPGHAMAVRQGFNIGAGTRRQEHIVTGNDFVGYLFKNVVSGLDFRIWEMNVLLQVIGTFMDGSKGEFYRSDVLDFGSERIKMVKEMEVVYASDAPSTFYFSTDLPEGAMTVRRAYTLPSTGASAFTMNEEATLKLRCPATDRGRLFNVLIRPQGNLRLEAIRFYLKSFGDTGMTAWTWTPLPVKPTQPAVWTPIPVPAPDMPA